MAPLYLFLIHHRFPLPKARRREANSVWITNFVLLAMISGLVALFGFVPWLIIQLIIIMVAGSIGVWLFYVQHQFEGAYWERREDWDYTEAALKGSSFYKLPKVLQWFSGNIGFHHIHHLSSLIPNYNLEKCNSENPIFEKYVTILTFRESLSCMFHKLWDEQSQRMITFQEFYRMERLNSLVRVTVR